MGIRSNFSAEVRERGVRMVLEHQHEHPSQWAAILSISSKIGCTAETLRRWVRRAERAHKAKQARSRKAGRRRKPDDRA